MRYQSNDLLCGAVGADYVFHLVRVRVLEAEAARPQPDQFSALSSESVHY